MRRHDDVFFPVGPNRDEGLLEVGDGHRIHWFEAGNPAGVPVVECHGGPGGRGNVGLRRLLDGERMRIVQFDQRGCGESTPIGELANTSLQHTIADMEQLREHLGIERWIVSGPSWGSTLAIAYGEAHPERTIAVKASGVWLCRAADTEWWYQGVRRFFPDTWAQFASLMPEDRRGDLRAAYHELINGDDQALAARAGQSLYEYEESFMHLEPPMAPPNATRGLAYARVFSHFATNDFFLRDNQLIDDAHLLAGVPVSLLTGRYDNCTTPDGAWDLAQVLDDVHLEFVNAAGHYPSEPLMSRAMALETTRFLDDLERRGFV
ncbi:MAG: alpha/beta fold hydrolase [Ilumatobacteraceae bacterium]